MIELVPVILSVLRSLTAYVLGNAAAQSHDSLLTQIATGIGAAIIASWGARNAMVNARKNKESNGPESDHK